MSSTHRQTLIIFLLLALFASGAFYLVFRAERTSDQRVVNTQKNANASIGAIVKAHQDFPESAQVIDASLPTTNWKTYNVPNIQATFKYPADWEVLPVADTNQLVPLPKRYVATYQKEVAAFHKDALTPLVISCDRTSESLDETYTAFQKENTSALVAGVYKPIYRQLQRFQLGENFNSVYYIWQSPNTDLQYFESQAGSTRCRSQMLTVKDSPLTKAEDAISYEIVKSIQYK